MPKSPLEAVGAHSTGPDVSLVFEGDQLAFRFK
jgi:hypothetical protein